MVGIISGRETKRNRKRNAEVHIILGELMEGKMYDAETALKKYLNEPITKEEDNGPKDGLIVGFKDGFIAGFETAKAMIKGTDAFGGETNGRTGKGNRAE